MMSVKLDNGVLFIEELVVYDLDGNKMTYIQGENIRLKKNYIIIDKGIYKIEMK